MSTTWEQERDRRRTALGWRAGSGSKPGMPLVVDPIATNRLIEAYEETVAHIELEITRLKAEREIASSPEVKAALTKGIGYLERRQKRYPRQRIA